MLHVRIFISPLAEQNNCIPSESRRSNINCIRNRLIRKCVVHQKGKQCIIMQTANK